MEDTAEHGHTDMPWGLQYIWHFGLIPKSVSAHFRQALSQQLAVAATLFGTGSSPAASVKTKIQETNRCPEMSGSRLCAPSNPCIIGTARRAPRQRGEDGKARTGNYRGHCLDRPANRAAAGGLRTRGPLADPARCRHRHHVEYLHPGRAGARHASRRACGATSAPCPRSASCRGSSACRCGRKCRKGWRRGSGSRASSRYTPSCRCAMCCSTPMGGRPSSCWARPRRWPSCSAPLFEGRSGWCTSLCPIHPGGEALWQLAGHNPQERALRHLRAMHRALPGHDAVHEPRRDAQQPADGAYGEPLDRQLLGLRVRLVSGAGLRGAGGHGRNRRDLSLAARRGVRLLRDLQRPRNLVRRRTRPAPGCCRPCSRRAR